MPVFHDDQHGTAIVVAAALINGCKIRGCRMEELRVTINGAGAAGIAVTKLLLGLGIGDVVLCDRGPLSRDARSTWTSRRRRSRG